MALTSITGLWKNEDKDYLSGKLGFARIYVFKNKNKKSENSPDYNLVFASDDREDESTDETPDENF